MAIPSTQHLIQATIAHAQVHPQLFDGDLQSMTSSQVDRLRFADGKVLPPSLKQWLLFDAKSLGLIVNDSNFVQPTPITAWGGYAFTTLQRLLLPENSYQLFPSGGDSMWFLYIDQADADGEYPIFVADVDDRYYVRLVAPNFAIWLADRYRAYDFNLYHGRNNPTRYRSFFQHPNFSALMRQQAQTHFHGYQYCNVFGEAITADGASSRWCSDDALIADLRQQGFDELIINQILGRDTSGL